METDRPRAVPRVPPFAGTVHLVSADRRLRAELPPLLELLKLEVVCHADVGALQSLPAANGAECIVFEDSPPVDVTAALEQLRLLRPGPAVIVLTRAVDVPRAVEIMRAGAADCLDADTAGATLLARLAQEMSGVRPPGAVPDTG